MEGFEVSGRRFRTEADYKAALRDQNKIEKIKAQVNMEQPGEVITLYAEIVSKRYSVMTSTMRSMNWRRNTSGRDMIKTAGFQPEKRKKASRGRRKSRQRIRGRKLRRRRKKYLSRNLIKRCRRKSFMS